MNRGTYGQKYNKDMFVRGASLQAFRMRETYCRKELSMGHILMFENGVGDCSSFSEG